MQKSLIIVLAVCLISTNSSGYSAEINEHRTEVLHGLSHDYDIIGKSKVHAFVKREAPATDNANYLENIQKQFGDLSKQVNDKLKETFNPDELKKGFNDAVNNINKAFEDLKAKSEAQKKE